MCSQDIWNLADSNVNLNLSDEFKANEVERYMSQYFLSDDTVHNIKRLFEKEMEVGLRDSDESAIQDPTVLGMKLSFLTELFDGNENGSFLVIHLNSQHLVLALTDVKPGFSVKTKTEYFTVAEHIRRSPYIMIFEYVCDCMLKFFAEHNLLRRTQIVGFCSDLPTVQLGIDDGVVSYFTQTARAFPLNCYDVSRCFEIVLLKERYKDIKIKLVILVTDNISAFVQASYILGEIDVFLNDCGLAYLEECQKVGKWVHSESETGHVLIDTELKNFGLNGCLDFICTDQDWLTISTPLNLLRTVSKHASMETFLSEKYVLELVKNILVDLNHSLLYCRSAGVGSLQENGVSLEDLYNNDGSKDNKHTSVLLPGRTIGGTEDDAKIAIYVCKVVLIRMTLLLSISIAGVLLRFQKEDFMIVVKRPLLQKHRHCETYFRNIMAKLAPGKKFQLLWSEDCSVVEGAALATSIANRLDRTKLHL